MCSTYIYDAGEGSWALEVCIIYECYAYSNTLAMLLLKPIEPTRNQLK
jgi:hypothetical protein